MTGYWNNWQVLSVVWCEIIGKTDNSWFAEQKLRDSTQMQPVNKLCTVINWSSPPMQRTYRFSCTYTQHSHAINCDENLIQQQQNNICFIILSFGQPTWAKKNNWKHLLTVSHCPPQCSWWDLLSCFQNFSHLFQLPHSKLFQVYH